MYLKRLEITNIRSISRLEWTAPSDNPAGWHVFLGNNGSGKSTLLQCIAALAIGRKGIERLGIVIDSWRRRGSVGSLMNIEIQQDEIQYDLNNNQMTLPLFDDPRVEYLLENPSFTDSPGKLGMNLWDAEKGWFIASFGPFRRFGKSVNIAHRGQIFSWNYKVIRHLTLFSEDHTLQDVLSWLKDLEFRRLKDHTESGQILEHIRSFINQVDFLPYGTRLEEITPDEIVFRDGNNVQVDLSDLSDGYRSILSLVFELIRQLTLCYPADLIFDPDKPGVVKAPGVVLIDEIDVHLHPQWQMRIGQWLCSRFPKIQFMVTTHSPLACHAAAQGSIFKLPEPGSDEPGRFLTEVERNRLLYGNVLEAYGSGAFGDVSTRSERGQQLLEELAQLNLRDFRDELNDGDKARQSHLMAIFPMGTES